MNEFGRNVEDYAYTVDRKGNWYWDFEGEVIGEGDVFFGAGEGFSINSYTGYSMNFAGEVYKNARTIPLRDGFTFSGNFTPVKLDLTAIIPGGEFDANEIIVSRLNEFGRNVEDYAYTVDRKGNWYWDFEGEVIGEGDVFFAPGEGFSVNSYKGYSITIPALDID